MTDGVAPMLSTQKESRAARALLLHLRLLPILMRSVLPHPILSVGCCSAHQAVIANP